MKNKIHLFFQKHRYNFLLFLAYFSITCVLYHKTVYAHFLFDWNTGLMQYLQQGIQGLAHCFNDKSMHWVSHALNILVFEIWGTNAYGWHFTLLAWHSLNALLLTSLVNRMVTLTNAGEPRFVSVIAALLWLVSPYHTDAVVWGGAMLHLGVSSFLFAGILCFTRHLETGLSKYMYLTYAWYLLAMFTLENFLIFPVLLLVVYLMYLQTHKPFARYFFIKLYLIPFVCLNAAYLLANKYYMGEWVGHYGEDAHLNTDIFLLVPNLTKYLSKMLYIPLFFTYAIRDQWYTFLHKPKVVYAALSCYGILFGVLAFTFFKTKKPVLRLSVGMFALCCVAMLPVISTYFAYSKDIEGDRYFYFLSSFFYAALAVILTQLGKKTQLLISITLITLSVLFLYRNNNYWYQSGNYANALMYDFKWQNAKRVFVLLSPDSYCGAYCLRNKPEGTLTEMLYVQRNIDMNGKMIEAYQWNAMSPYDSASCTVIDSHTVEVKLHGHGGWLWYKSFGATNTENEFFKTTLNEWYPQYTITFKQKQPGDVFIFANNKHWQQLDNF